MPGEGPVRIHNLNAMEASSFDGMHRIAVEVSGNTVTATVTRAADPDPASEVRNRKRVEHIWIDRFNRGGEVFIAAQSIDTSRPRGKDPIQWNYVTFDEGLKMAKETGKMLYVDVMAFWCHWCYRLDYYTYPDDQVATLMNGNFIPVKFIHEQDRARDYGRIMGLLEARGVPAMGIFDGDGNLVHKIRGGWKKPEDFIKELETAISKR